MQKQNKTLASILGASVAAMLIAFTVSFEGTSLEPYSDPAGKMTVCIGETNTEMRNYTLAECKAMLATSLSSYVQEIKDMTPGFDSLTDGQKIAVVDFVYNLGADRYKNSTIRKRYSEKAFPQACDEFLRWKIVSKKDCSVKTNNCYGIWLRRQNEAKMCRGEYEFLSPA
jgi:GH24 family phage-related lysozyme (muramidase)